MIWILLALCPQADPSSQARVLVERLGSEQFEVREQATRSLKEMGKRATPELRRGALNKDPEVRARSLFLLRVIEISSGLTSNLIKAMPGVEDRLAGEDARIWTVVFLEATGVRDGKRTFSSLSAPDVDLLAGPALRGASTPEESSQVCRVIQTWLLKSAVPDLVKLLGQEEVVSKKSSLWALEQLGASSAIPKIAELCNDPTPAIRAGAAMALGTLNARSESARIARLLRDPHPNVRSAAGSALAALGMKEFLPEVTALLLDECSSVRHNATWALAGLAGQSAALEVMKLLNDPEGSVRKNAAEVLGNMDEGQLARDARRLLTDRDPALRRGAAAWLCHKASPDGIPVILQESNDLSWLNAVRSPEAWVRMSKMTLSVEGGTWQQALESLAKELGVKFEAPALAWLSEDAIVGYGLEPLELLVRPGSPAQFILEADRIRILSLEDARAFWRAWQSRKTERK